MSWRARHVSRFIDRAPADVIRFVGEPKNLPQWAAGLSAGIHESEKPGVWVSESPMGKVEVRFAAPNDLGVLDHDVTLPNGDTVHNPMRVVPNGAGSEVTFTLFQQPGMSDEEFARDARTVETDLRKLKEVMEKEQVTWRSISSQAVTSRWNAGNIAAAPRYFLPESSREASRRRTSARSQST